MIEQFSAATESQLLAELSSLEAQLNQVRYRQLAVLAELRARNVAGTLGFRGLPDLIVAQLRCTRTEARRRAQAMERFGARRALTGESLEPKYPAAAEAFSIGEIGTEHAAVIADTVEAIPADAQAEDAAPVEATLLGARTHDGSARRPATGPADLGPPPRSRRPWPHRTASTAVPPSIDAEPAT